MNKKILVVVITYNIAEKINHCLDSLIKQTYQNYDLLLIDNNSSNKTLIEIQNYLNKNKSLMKKTELIKNKSNLGFSKAVNIGIKKALKENEYFSVLLLNQDIFFEKNLLKKGIDLLEKENSAGAILPKILYPNGKVWWMGTKPLSNKELLFSPYHGIVKHINKGKKINFSKNRIMEVKSLTGCAVFLKFDAIKKTGLFDERYFMYAEDIDYSIRLKRNGYKILLFTNSAVYHEVEDDKMNFKIVKSRLKKYKIYLTSIGLYLLKHKPWIFPVWLLKLPYSLTFNYFKSAK